MLEQVADYKNETEKYFENIVKKELPRYKKENLMIRCIFRIDGEIKYRNIMKMVLNRNFSLQDNIDVYRKAREDYINLRKNPKFYDDKLANATYQLNSIPIRLN